MKANELLVRFLAAAGVEFLFGIPGSPLMPLFHALYAPDSRIKVIFSKHEAGSAFMADGYARVSGRLGVCCGTTGPGTTNLLTGVAASYADSIPLLVITAQVSTHGFGRGAAQESTGEDRSFSSVDLLRTATKTGQMVFAPDHLPFVLNRALRSAMLPRTGPVHVNIPPDVMRQEVKGTDHLIRSTPLEAAYFDRRKVKEAARALLRANRPVFLLGFGTILSRASDEVREIAELLSIPVATTPKGKGAFPEDHPLALGPFGLAGTPAAGTMILGRDQADLLFAIGTDFDEWSTNGWDPQVKGTKTLIHLDIDPAQIGKNYQTDIGLVGDATTICRELWFELAREIKRSGFVNQQSEGDTLAFKRHHPLLADPGKMEAGDIPIKPQRLIHDIRLEVPRHGVFFIDAGNNMLWAIHYLQVFEPGTFNIALASSPMGYSIPAAIGGKLAAPDRPVIAICGDGGFLMHGMEVATAVNYGIPVIWVVLNDSRFNMILQAESLQKKPGVDRYVFHPTDFAQVARGLGAQGFRIEDPAEIRPRLREALASGLPTVLDVLIDPDELSPLKDRVKAIQKVLG